jgi:hypothetical protein
VLHYYFPESFEGLPLWVIPIFRIITIFTFVISFIEAAGFVIMTLMGLIKACAPPIRKRKIRKTLLKAGFYEVLILTKALVKIDKTFTMNPNLEVTLKMQDQGLIEVMTIAFSNDLEKRFKVKDDVWKIMLTMEEFKVSNRKKFKSVMRSNSNSELILSVLPQLHPAVIREQTNLPSENGNTQDHHPNR